MPVLYPFKTNWSDSLTLDFEYRTEVITSRNNTEQRRAGRTQPRLSIKFKATPIKAAAQGLKPLLRTTIMESVAIPHVTAAVAATAPSSAATSVVHVAVPAPFWVVPGKWLTVVTSEGEELHEIVSVTTGDITLVEPLLGSVATGARVCQALTGVLDQNSKGSLITTRAAKTDTEFKVDPGDNQLFEDDYPTFPDMLAGLPVLLVKPDWSRGLDLAALGFLETLDFGIGKVQHDTDIEYADVTIQASYTLMDRAAVDRMELFFHALKGQQKQFWVPVWDELVIDISLGAAEGVSLLTVPGDVPFNDFEATGEDFYGAFFVQYRNGDVQFNPIIGVSLVSGNTRYDVTDNWDQQISTALVANVWFMSKARSMLDSLSMEFLTNTVATTQLTYKYMQVDSE